MTVSPYSRFSVTRDALLELVHQMAHHSSSLPPSIILARRLVEQSVWIRNWGRFLGCMPLVIFLIRFLQSRASRPAFAPLTDESLGYGLGPGRGHRSQPILP